MQCNNHDTSRICLNTNFKPVNLKPCRTTILHLNMLATHLQMREATFSPRLIVLEMAITPRLEPLCMDQANKLWSTCPEGLSVRHRTFCLDACVCASSVTGRCMPLQPELQGCIKGFCEQRCKYWKCASVLPLLLLDYILWVTGCLHLELNTCLFLAMMSTSSTTSSVTWAWPSLLAFLPFPLILSLRAFKALVGDKLSPSSFCHSCNYKQATPC